MFIVGVVDLVCEYHSQVMAGKNRPLNDLLCVEWDVKLYTLTRTVIISCICILPRLNLKYASH